MKYIVSHFRTCIKTMWPKWTRVCTKIESPSFRQQKGGIRKRERKLTACKSHGCLVLIQQPFSTWSCRTLLFLFHCLFMECWVKLKQVTSCPYRHLQSFHRSSHFLLSSDRLFPEDKEEAVVALQTLPRPPPQSLDTWTTHTVWCWVFCTFTGLVWLTAQPLHSVTSTQKESSQFLTKQHSYCCHNSRMLRGLLTSLRHRLIKKGRFKWR